MKLSVIIPVWNEEKTIAEVIKKVREVDIPKEIIVIDDGSTDKTPKIIEKEKNKRGDEVKVYYSPVNFGKGAGVRIGYKFAKGDIAIIQDADLELDPNEYHRLIEPILARETKVVYGSRFLTKNRNIKLVTRLGNKLITMLFNLLFNSKLTDVSTGYKVMRTDVAKSLGLKTVGFDIDPEISVKLRKKGIKILEVPVRYNPREMKGAGKKVNYLKDGVKNVLFLLKNRVVS